MAFDWKSLLSLLMGAGETAGGAATGNPLLAMQGVGQMAQGGAGMAGVPGFGNTTGPPSNSGMGMLGQLGGQMQGGVQAIAPLMGAFQPQQHQPPQAVHPQGGPSTPFQTTPPPTASAGGGGGSLLEMLKKLLGQHF